MDLSKTVLVNRQILKSIRSKHDEFFPGAYSTPESRYYRMLKRDTEQAEAALKHGGLAVPEEEG